MGLFDFLKKKKSDDTTEESSLLVDESELTSQLLSDEIETEAYNEEVELKENEILDNIKKEIEEISEDETKTIDLFEETEEKIVNEEIEKIVVSDELNYYSEVINIDESDESEIETIEEENNIEAVEYVPEVEDVQEIQEVEKIQEVEEVEEIEEEVKTLDEIVQDIKEIQEQEDNITIEEFEEKPKKIGLFEKLKKGLGKTKDNIVGGLDSVLGAFTKIDEDLFEELEETLIMADLGVETSIEIIEKLRERVKKERVTEVSQVKEVIVKIITEILEENNEPLVIEPPTIILVIGVNGVGKTTTIGKLTNKFIQEGKTVQLGAADTFRAAAIDQLQVWADRSKVNLIKHQENSDPGSVVFDAVKSAKARKTDVLIIDTAGRLHNKKNLMEELRKINKIIEREYEEANLEVFLALDSTTGQNAMQQAKQFNEVTNITGLILTKLDGTAKGGIIVSIKNELDVPVRFIGIGEQIDDLETFDASMFARALFDMEAL